ncbi:MAG: U32 family peptidase [Mariprofundaceae bacterium]
MDSSRGLKLAVGPLLFGWPERKIRDLYMELAEQPEIDILYLGEVVCSKRSISGVEWQVELARELAASGKELVLSTLAMPTAAHELQAIRDLVCAALEDGMCIEANDMAAVAIASEAGVGFVAGPHLNIYSRGTLDRLRRHGAMRAVLPLELPARDIAAIVGDAPVAVEYFAHGKLPLTFSARCYTARAEGLSKRDCRHVCFLNPDGVEMRTLDGGDFATINGIQIMSQRPFTALDHVREIAGFGVDILRISPQASGLMDIITHFRTAMDDAIPARDALHAMTGGRAPNTLFCNGYYHGRQGRLWIEE